MQHIDAGIPTYKTTNYDMFKRLFGNRLTNDSEISTLAAIMRHIGWLGAPIIVNEHMEVIDGQNRLAAAKIAGIEVYYQIFSGYNISHCIILNKNSRNWNNTDYVHSFAEQGFDTYIWLVELYNEANKDRKYISLDDLTCLAYCEGKSVTGNNTMRDILKEGKFDLDANQRAAVEQALDFLKQFFPFFKKVGGRQDPMYNAVLFCRSQDIDEDKLLNKVFASNWHKIAKNSSIAGFLAQIDTLYNKGIKQNSKRVELFHTYNEGKKQYGVPKD